MADHLNDADDVAGQFIGTNPIEQFLARCGQSCGCPVTVRYECGECCLKATNCRLSGIVGNFLGLRAFSPPGIITEPCECEECEGPSDLIGFAEADGDGKERFKVPYLQPATYSQCALIPLNRVCSIESGAIMAGGLNGVAGAEKGDD